MRNFLIFGLVALTLAACARPQEPNADAATVAAVRYREPGPATLTLYTMVNNRSGSGGHSSLMINASERIIFDPAGSFKADIIPEQNDVLFGITPPAEQAYRRSHARETHHVLVQHVEVTAEQAQLAYNMARQMGPIPGAYCANATSRILSSIPGYEDIKVTFYPTKLAEQFGAKPGVVSERYYENDSGDLQLGIAQNNAALNATVVE
ncbi:MAG: hypothetical protein GJ676_20755 [Rhodobacteraceae bacterium]|nr:hypothetical protein [Paracoccaceae bacterium]